MSFHHTIRLSAVQLAFEYVPSHMIVRVLEAADTEEVRGIDLSFNSLSRLDRLQSVCEALQKFHRLENVCFAYNCINATESPPLLSSLKKLSNLVSRVNYDIDRSTFVPRVFLDFVLWIFVELDLRPYFCGFLKIDRRHTCYLAERCETSTLKRMRVNNIGQRLP